MSDKIEQLFRELKPEYELEARIQGYFTKKPNVSKYVQDNLARFECRKYEEVSRIVKDNKDARYRHRDDGTFVCKSALIKESFENEWYTVHVSSEVEIPMSRYKEIFGDEPSYTTITRYSMIVHGCLVEIGRNVEVEKLPDSTPEQFKQAIIYIVTELQNSASIVTLSDYKALTTVFGKANVYKPVTLNMAKVLLLRTAKYISPKYDGLRKFLIFRHDKVAEIDLIGHVRFVSVESEHEPKYSVVDCELVGDTYYSIEVLIDGGRVLKNFDERLSMRSRFTIQQKPYFPYTCMEDIYKYSVGEHIDGTIIVCRDELLKWKKVVTIDLIVRSDMQHFKRWKLVGDFPRGVICEFIIHEHNKSLEFLRTREDKPKPNSLKVFSDNTTGVISEDMLKGVGLKFLTLYHDKLKTTMVKGNNIITLNDIGQDRMLNDADTVTAYYCLNNFADGDFVKLSNILQSKLRIEGKFVGLILWYAETFTCDAFSITMTGENTYIVGSGKPGRILDMNFFSHWVINQGFSLDFMSVCDEFDKWPMSYNEQLLSRCFAKFSFTKL